MKAASLNELKVELSNLQNNELTKLCLRLAKFKKENKELLSFLLFESADIQTYVANVKAEIDHQFSEINKSNLYFAKKSLRKILRFTNKSIKYTLSKQVGVELLIYFCFRLKISGIPIHKSAALTKLFNMQIKKINKETQSLHEDLQYDFLKQLENLK